MFGLIVVALCFVYAARITLQLLRHRAIAREIGLPYMIFPVAEENILYQTIFETRLVPYLVNNWLSEDLADYINGSIYKCRWTVKDRLRTNYGGVYLTVTPGGLTCNISDAPVAHQVCGARHSFPKPVEKYDILAIFGPNILTTEKSEWSHHRRHTAGSFNEKNNALVWKESIRQTTEMLDHWGDVGSCDRTRSSFVVLNAREGILKFALHVICGAGFGVKLPFKPTPEATHKDIQALFKDAQSPPAGYHYTFRSLMEYMNHHVRSVFLANGVLPKWIPRALLPLYKPDFDAHDDLQSYLRAMVTSAELQGSQNDHNLLEEIVNARNGEPEKAKTGNGTSSAGFSEEEIHGNLYIFTVAGHETTATTLRYALVLLALNPGVQDELHQEIRQALCDEPLEPEEWDYSRVFPKLVAPLCVMLETLRLHPPVVTIPKCTGNSPASITLHDQVYHLPPRTYVNLNVTGLHYAEQYWGPDAAKFVPWRWDSRNRESVLAGNDNVEGLSGPGLEYKTIHKPVRGSYIPFSDGVRACLGKKFAQVEFVVAISILFRDYHVGLGPIRENETTKEIHRRAVRAIQTSSTFLTLSMQDEVPLLFRRRGPTVSQQGGC